MTNDQPISTIKQQSQTDLPIVSDDTLVDDTVKLVDSNSPSGGKVVTVPASRSKLKPTTYGIKIKIRR